MSHVCRGGIYVERPLDGDTLLDTTASIVVAVGIDKVDEVSTRMPPLVAEATNADGGDSHVEQYREK